MPDDESQAMIGYTSTFEVAEGADGAFTKVAEVTSITPPGMTRETVDVTHLESPGGMREFIGSLTEGGEASITINFVPTEQHMLLQAFNVPRGRYRLTFPNRVRMTFSGVVTGFELGDVVVDDKLSAIFTVKQSGPVSMDRAEPVQGADA